MPGTAVGIDAAFLHHDLDVLLFLEYADVLRRIALDGDDVGQLAGLDGAQLALHLDRARGIAGGGQDGFHVGHAELDVDFHLAGIGAHLGIETHVGAERDVDSGLVHFLESLEAVRLQRLHLVQNELRSALVLARLDRVVGAVEQRRRHPGAGLGDHVDGLFLMEHHVFDGVCTGFERHALAVGREAVHRGDLVEGVRLVDDGVDLLLRHVADVRLFLVGAAAAGGAGLDDVATGQQVGPRQLAQLPGAVGGLEAVTLRRARLDQVEV